MSTNQKRRKSDAEQRRGHDEMPDEAGAQGEALLSSELSYRRLFESAQDGILILDAKTGMITDVNPFLVNLLGYSREFFLTKKVWELGFLGDAIANEDIFRELQTKGYVRYEDLPLETSDGQCIEVEFVSNIYPVNEDWVIQCNIRDITKRKQVEEQNRFKADIIENSPLIVAYHDKDLNVVWINKAYQKAAGLSLEEVRGKKCYQVWNLSKPCRGCPVITAMETGESAAYELTPDNQDHWPESQGCWFIQAMSFRDKQGTVIGALEFSIDITKRKKAEDEREKLHAQLNQAQKMESVGRLAGGVAHDFNNMLGIILGYTELALERVGLDESLHADLEEIRRAAQRSADLTRQLLAFSRKQTIAPKVLDFNATVKDMLNMLRQLIGEDINLAWKPGRGLWPINMDPSQIDQMLVNLCVNARDAIADIGTISVETCNTTLDEEYCAQQAGFAPGEYVMLTVSDDGCGMDAETLLSLFEPFFTTKEQDKGTGLGLATVYGIVKQNNGFINVYSEPGQGTTFNIYLPRYAAKTEPLPKKVPVQATVRGHETILLVEDEPAILKMTTIMLERHGYTVLKASIPGEAIRLAREHIGRIDLLLTDVIMPEMNGRELSENLVSIHPDIKLLFMSGYTANVITKHGVLNEGEHFIQKPFTMNDLGMKLREVMEG